MKNISIDFTEEEFQILLKAVNEYFCGLGNDESEDRFLKKIEKIEEEHYGNHN